MTQSTTHLQQPSRITPAPRPGYHGKYPMWIGHKFDSDGTVLPFPGHGIMCMLPDACEMRTAFDALKADTERQDFAKSLAFLPPAVWHMTIYEGVSDKIRVRDCWPGELPLDCSLAQCNEYVIDQLRMLDLKDSGRFRMKPTGWESVKDGICLRLSCVDAAEERRLRGLRDRLGSALQLFHPGFKTYTFHMGMAYQLELLSVEEEEDIRRYLQEALSRLPETIEMQPPWFCTYDGMCDLTPRSSLSQSQCR